MKRGFTLIELLIVVAIIAILAAIAVPNFLEAQTRSKVARADADMRSIATGLESYRVDNNHYPRDIGTGWIDPSGYYPSMPFLIGLRPITTPIAYMTSLPKDPFIPKAVNWPETYVYYCEDKALTFGPYAGLMIWQLSSMGPNEKYEFNFITYDPTNGTVSSGDIFRWGPGMGVGH